MIKSVKPSNIVEIPNNYNTRHFGDYVTSGGQVVVKEKIIRSGETAGFKEEDIWILRNNYHLKRVIDLRSREETEKIPSLDHIPEVEYINLDLLGDIFGVSSRRDCDNKNSVHRSKHKSHEEQANSLIQLFNRMGGKTEAVIAYFSQIYLSLVKNEYSQLQMRKFFDLLLDNEDGCILFHCTGGKDRTGVSSALLLSALGVDWDKCVEDFLLTNECSAELNEAIMNEVIKQTDDQNAIEGVNFILSTNVIYINKVYDFINTHYGSIGHYLSEILELTAEKISRLQTLYTAQPKK